MVKDNSNDNIDREKEIEKLYTNLESVTTNSNEVANAVVNIAKDILFDFNEKAKDQSKNWFDQLDKDTQDKYQSFTEQFKAFFGDEKSGEVSREGGKSTDIFHQLKDKFFEGGENNKGSKDLLHTIKNTLFEENDIKGAGEIFSQIKDTIFEDGSLQSSYPKLQQLGEKFINKNIDWFNTKVEDGFVNPLQDLLAENGRTPFGLYAYKTPTTQLYNDCLKKQGESVWDSQGYWRCLFPNSQIPAEFLKYKSEKKSLEILTKEDLDDAIKSNGLNHSDSILDLKKSGIFFKKFDDYLNWKNIMFENVKQEKQNRIKKYVSDKNQGKELEKHVISSTLQSNYITNPDSNSVELNEIKTETFSDGTSLTTKIIKSKPYGADKWDKVDEVVENGESNQKGWFWNK